MNFTNSLIKNINYFINDNLYIKKFYYKFSLDNELSNNLVKFIKYFYNIYLQSSKNIQKYFINKGNYIYLDEKYYTITNTLNYNYLNKLFKSEYINKNKSRILSNINANKKININNLSIDFYYNKNLVRLHEIDNLIFHIFNIYNIISNIFNKSNKKIYITIFYSNIKKLHSNNLIDSKNMNSGLSYSNKIIIYRKEEILKVFTHELLHTLNIDNNYHILSKSNKKLSKIFQINSDNNFNESYTEFIAIIIHTLYFSCLKSKNISETIKFFKIYIAYEITFFLFQLSKFLNVYNLNFIDFFYNNDYIENTNTFSYIYLKFLLFINYNRFFDSIYINNRFILFDENKIIKHISYLHNKNIIIYLNDLTSHIKTIILKYCKNKNNTNKQFCINNRLSIFEITF